VSRGSVYAFLLVAIIVIEAGIAAELVVHRPVTQSEAITNTTITNYTTPTGIPFTLATTPYAAQPSPTQSITQAAQPQSAKYITIGVAAPLTSPVGASILNGTILGVQVVNSHGGVIINGTHYFFRVVAEDNQGENVQAPPSTAVEAVEKLVYQDGAQFIIGGSAGNSAAEEAVESILPYLKTIYLEVGDATTAETLNVAANPSAYKYFFRVFPPNSSMLGTYLLEFFGALKYYSQNGLEDVPNVTNVGILAEDAAWTQPIMTANGGGPMSGELPQDLENILGYNVVYSSFFPLTTTDFTPYLQQMATLHVQLIVTLMATDDSIYFVKQWGTFPWPNGKPLVAGINVLAGLQPGYWNATDGLASSVISLGAIPPVSIIDQYFPENFSGQQYAYSFNITEAYDDSVKEFGVPPFYTGLGSLSAVFVLANAIQRAQSLNTDKVIVALEKTDLLTPEGIVRFTSDHDLNAANIPIYWAQWHSNGQIYPIWSYLYPSKIFFFEPPS